MALRRLLLPVAAPSMVAGVLVVGSQSSGDDASPLPSRPPMTQRVAEASPERPPEPCATTALLAHERASWIHRPGHYVTEGTSLPLRP